MIASAACATECRRALSALERLLEEHPENLEGALLEATHSVVALRGRLTSMSRESPQNATWRDQLAHTNAILSVLMAGHYPIEGVRWDCIKQARDALAAFSTGEAAAASF
jgi:hypothetical protein